MLLKNPEATEKKVQFLSEISPEFHFNRLFDHLPGVLFFVKNRNGQILFANEGLVRLYGFENEKDFIGRTDFELLPRRLAEKYRSDDLKILDSGRPLLGIVELFLNSQGIPEWYLTHKLPVLSKTGQAIGVMGTIQEYRGPDPRGERLVGIGPAVDYLKSHFKENVPVSLLADLTDLSLRQFERKFKAAFNTTPHQYIIKMRVHLACDLLRDRRMAISDIASELGFTDQSAFATHFKKNMGYTPLQYRKRYL
jgi:PAS domain S-box-containing protein